MCEFSVLIVILLFLLKLMFLSFGFISFEEHFILILHELCNGVAQSIAAILLSTI